MRHEAVGTSAPQSRSRLAKPHLTRGATLARRLIASALAALACASACADARVDRPPTAPGSDNPEGISRVASNYLNEILTIMQGSSVKRLTIEWDNFRTSVFATAGNAQSIIQTYGAIVQALKLLDDHHSTYTTTGGKGNVLFGSSVSCAAAFEPRPPLPSTIGYVSVRRFTGTAAQALAFADSIQATIRNADRADLVGWIVDLRGNAGGNMWPMIAGLGPVLGDGIVGYFIDPSGTTVPWSYHDDASWIGGSLAQQVGHPYRLLKPYPRVAVLTDRAVASSGEAAVIAFRERAESRSFGGATCGLSTANNQFTLSDGAVLNLAVSTMADRTLAKYGDVVVPDEVFTDGTATVARAVAWLQGTTR